MEQPEQPNVEQADPPDHMSALPAEIFCIIMQLLQLWEHISLRRVCHSWKVKVEESLSDGQVPRQALKINVRKARRMDDLRQIEPHSWQPMASVRQMHFDFVYKESAAAADTEGTPFRKEQITMSGSAFNSDSVKAIGGMFAEIQELVIYWDTDDTEQNIDSLVVLLSQQFKSLTTFGLIVSGKFARRTSLAQIGTAIEANFSKLKQLHLMVPISTETTHPQTGIPIAEFHATVYLDKAIKSITSFSSSALVPNLFVIPNRSVCYCQLHTLTVQANLFSIFNIITRASGITQPIEQGMRKLLSVKRLQLLGIITRNDMDPWIELLPNVEQLHLTHKHPFQTDTRDLTMLCRNVKFGYNWIRVLKRFTQLTELTLHGFGLEFMSLKAAIDNALEMPVERFDQVRKLTFASPDLFYQFQRFNKGPFFPGLKVYHIGHSIGIRFPGLHELNLWSGDGDLHETTDQTWQTLERTINEQLPEILLQIPTLRVNVQMRHPVMHNEYISQSAQVLQDNRDHITRSNADKMNLCNQLIRSVSGVYEADYVVRLLNGNFNKEQDGEEVERLMRVYQNLSIIDIFVRAFGF